MGLLATGFWVAGACSSDRDREFRVPGGGASGESATPGDAGEPSSSSGGDSSSGANGTGASNAGGEGGGTPVAGTGGTAGATTGAGAGGEGGTPQPCSPDPSAYDFPDNGIDDDCNGDVDDVATCDEGLASNPAQQLAYAQAIDLCAVTTQGEASWGVLSTKLSLVDGAGVLNTTQRSVRPNFGSGLAPRRGGRFAVLATGTAAAPTQVGPAHQAFQPGYENGTSSQFPTDWRALNGNTLPNAPGCPSPTGSVANDPAMLTIEVRVPSNAHAFSVQAFFLSSEFPEYVCSPYNDFFVALLDSTYAGTPANPVDKNLAVYVAPANAIYPLGVNLARGNTGLFRACLNGTTGCDATIGSISTCTSTTELVGSGFDGSSPGDCDVNSLVGGGTGWLTLRGNVEPGEIATLRLAIWDTGDQLYDSVVLLDAFEWLPDPVDPGAYAE